MKKIKNILFIIGMLGVVFSCDRDLESEGIAAGTIRYPAIQVQGDPITIVKAGSTYTDAGAKAFLGADDITNQLEIISNVNTSTPGVYSVDYAVTITNELDQEASVTEKRLIVVAPNNPNTSRDLSGTYARTSNGAIANWTKVAEGVYLNDNVGGVVTPSIAALPVYVFHYADNSISIPLQPVPNGYGELAATIVLTATGYTINVANAGFLTNTRTFVKQ